MSLIKPKNYKESAEEEGEPQLFQRNLSGCEAVNHADGIVSVVHQAAGHQGDNDEDNDDEQQGEVSLEHSPSPPPPSAKTDSGKSVDPSHPSQAAEENQDEEFTSPGQQLFQSQKFSRPPNRAGPEKIKSPFDTVCIKHIRRQLNMFEDYYFAMIRDFATHKTQLRLQYDKEKNKIEENENGEKKSEQLDLSPQQMTHGKILLEDRLAAHEQRFRASVNKLVQGFDSYLDGMATCPLLLPISVTLSLDKRPLSFEMSCRAVDSLGDIRALLETSMRELGEDIVAYGENSRFGVQHIVLPDDKEFKERKQHDAPQNLGTLFHSLFRSRSRSKDHEKSKNMTLSDMVVYADESYCLNDIDLGSARAIHITLLGDVTLKTDLIPLSPTVSAVSSAPLSPAAVVLPPAVPIEIKPIGECLDEKHDTGSLELTSSNLSSDSSRSEEKQPVHNPGVAPSQVSEEQVSLPQPCERGANWELVGVLPSAQQQPLCPPPQIQPLPVIGIPVAQVATPGAAPSYPVVMGIADNPEQKLEREQIDVDIQLAQLLEMGFVEVERNRALLSKHNGDMQQVVYELAGTPRSEMNH
mmetsp:Transcript_33328/g.65458  ORF Transcript_33328/g.65458 Transcript_33328/m.65458 type:complete len:581 (+) Transcript_33328:2784-4526(+)